MKKEDKKTTRPDSDIDPKLSTKIKELEAKIAELTNGWQRTQADFVNYKKQVNDERTTLLKSANYEMIYQLLPVLDNFQLAARHLPREFENNNWAMGIKSIKKQFEQILKDEGLEIIESVGTNFDPNIHEAIEQVESNKPHGQIIEEVLSGYKFGHQIIRPAKVKVST